MVVLSIEPRAFTLTHIPSPFNLLLGDKILLCVSLSCPSWAQTSLGLPHCWDYRPVTPGLLDNLPVQARDSYYPHFVEEETEAQRA